MADISEQQELCLAKAVANSGNLTTSIIKNVYSSNIDIKSKLQTLEAKGFITKVSENPVRFKVKLKETENGVKFDLPQDIVNMGKNIKESSQNVEKQKELYERLENE